MSGAFSPIPSEKLQLLHSEYTWEEVYLALKSMGNWKSPGPDRFRKGFYQKSWNCVGEDVSAMVLDILKVGDVRPELVEVLLVLIPKKDNPESIRKIRTISLCNVTFKLITKVLVNRLKNVIAEWFLLIKAASSRVVILLTTSLFVRR